MLLKRMCHIVVVVEQTANADVKAASKNPSSRKAGK
jgi:hypothetical protein